MQNEIKKYLPLVLAVLLSISAGAQVKEDTAKVISVKYGNKGIELRAKDDKFLFQLQSRFQFRFSTPNDQDPLTYDDYSAEKQTTLKINRARLKVTGVFCECSH